MYLYILSVVLEQIAFCGFSKIKGGGGGGVTTAQLSNALGSEDNFSFYDFSWFYNKLVLKSFQIFAWCELYQF